LKTFRSERVARFGWSMAAGWLWIATSPLALAQGAPARDPPRAAAPATDDAGDPKLAEARTAFREGTALARQAQWGEALLAFERSARLRPHTFTTYNIGFCERALGRYTRAHKMLARALAENEARGGTALSADVAADAKRYLVDLDARLARAMVTLDPADAAVAVDGRPLDMIEARPSTPLLSAGTRDLGAPETPPSSRFELLLDPGAHVFVVSKTGGPDAIVTRAFDAGSKAELELKLAPRPLPEPAKAAAPPLPPSPPPTPSKDREVSARWPGYVALGLGAAGVALGSVAGVVALQKKNKLDDACGATRTECPSSARRDRDALVTWADVATISFGVGLAGAVGSIVLFATGAPSVARDAHLFVVHGSF
jgi:hypothetical protein